jgi:AcrR family transcriptional regulator
MSRRAGRPATPILDRDTIARGALELIDEVGPEGLSLAALAEHLGVRPSSFYNHVTGKDDILAGVRELISDSIPAQMFAELPWDQALASWARGYRLAFAAHPKAIPLLATTEVAGAKRTFQSLEQVITGLERGGWPKDIVISVMVAVESFILGSALDLVAPPSNFDPGPFRDEVPAFTESVAARDKAAADQGRPPADLAFEVGLAALIDGLRALLNRTQ